MDKWFMWISLVPSRLALEKTQSLRLSCSWCCCKGVTKEDLSIVMIIHLWQIQLTGSMCLKLQKSFHVAVLGGFNSDLRISQGANQGTRRVHNPIYYDIGKALRPSYGGFIDPKNSNHTVPLEEPFPALSKRLSPGKKKRLSLGFVPKRIY